MAAETLQARIQPVLEDVDRYVVLCSVLVVWLGVKSAMPLSLLASWALIGQFVLRQTRCGQHRSSRSTRQTTQLLEWYRSEPWLQSMSIWSIKLEGMDVAWRDVCLLCAMIRSFVFRRSWNSWYNKSYEPRKTVPYVKGQFNGSYVSSDVGLIDLATKHPFLPDQMCDRLNAPDTVRVSRVSVRYPKLRLWWHQSNVALHHRSTSP